MPKYICFEPWFNWIWLTGLDDIIWAGAPFVVIGINQYKTKNAQGFCKNEKKNIRTLFSSLNPKNIMLAVSTCVELNESVYFTWK